ncbi:MAG: hypothetical protein OEY52_08210 [Gammaproteobacteria bacterium]|nr:hypothetical protein [Gammaproteobacteria bacterium]
MNELFIKAGGVYNILLVIFHLMFWKLFDWEKDLRSLRFLNRAIIQVLNISLTLVFVIFAYLSLWHTQELLSTRLGNHLIFLISLFWLARAIQQPVFFKLQHWGSWGFMVFFLVGSAIYFIPFIGVYQ